MLFCGQLSHKIVSEIPTHLIKNLEFPSILTNLCLEKSTHQIIKITFAPKSFELKKSRSSLSTSEKKVFHIMEY